MAWIKWRTTRSGSRNADLRWIGPDGRERSRSLRTSDPVAAAAAVLDHDRASQGRRVERSPDATAADLLESFYSAVAEERSPETVAFYRKHLSALAAQMPEVIHAWTPVAFRRACVAGGGRVPTLAPRTVQMRVNAARRFRVWAARNKVQVPDFVGDFRGRATVRRIPTALSPEERTRLLAAAFNKPIERVVALAALAGLRPAEWRAAQWSDVRWRTREIVVRGPKKHKERLLPMGAALLDVLERHRDGHGPIVGDVGDVRARLRALSHQAGIDHPVHPYELRHTYATLLAASGADVPTIGTLMGHASPSTTLRYLHTDPARLRAAVDRAT